DGFTQHAEAHPVQSLCGVRQFLRRFLFESDHRHVDALAPGAFEHEKRKASVARDQAPSCCGCVSHELERRRGSFLRHFTIPRSDVSTNRINSATSSESPN